MRGLDIGSLAARAFQRRDRINLRGTAGAGEGIRTPDLRITSASSGNLPQSEESPEAQDLNKIETSETERNGQDRENGDCAPTPRNAPMPNIAR